MVVPELLTSDVVLEVKVAGGPDEVRLALASGGSEVQLLDDGLGIDLAAGDEKYTVGLSPSDVLFDFAADDVNRNFVGYLRLYQGGAQLTQRNLFVDILTPDVPVVTHTAVSPTVQYTDHLVNIVDPVFFTAIDPSINLQAVAQAFYAEFPDNYDFINIIYEIPYPANRNSDLITNSVENIGTPIRANAAGWGSAGRLLGRVEFPIPTLLDGAEPSYLHELGHHWVNFLDVSPLDLAVPHWPISDLAAGIMGWGMGPNTQGLQFNFDLVPSGPDFLLVANNDPKVYTDLSLYLMGLMSADEVADHFVFDDENQTPLAGGVLQGPVTMVTIDDVVSAMGARTPDHTQAPKKFRVATILVSRDGLVPADVMRLYDYFSARAEGTDVVSFASGLAKGQSNPFYLATAGSGQLDTRIMHRVLIDASRDGGLWWFPQAGPFDPNAAHQGQLLADYIQSSGYLVDELPRSSSVTRAVLDGYDIVIRAVGFGAYTAEEISAYQQYVQAGGNLLLLADHSTNAPADDLALSFGLEFGGTTRGGNQLTSYVAHPITDGVGPLHFNVGSGLLSYPSQAQILGTLSVGSYLDLNNNGVQDTSEPSAADVMGVMAYGAGQIVFCGDTNLWEVVPQPLMRNLLNWFEDP